MATDRDVALVENLCAKIGPILQGQGPDIQSAVLAELSSMWAAGFVDPTLRETMLAMHIQHIRDLIPINSAILMSRQTKQ